MANEFSLDLRPSWLNHGMTRIGRPLWARLAGQGPTGPSAPPTLIAARRTQSIGVMLKMHPRVSDEHVSRGVPHNPSHCGIGPRPLNQHRIIRRKIGTHGPVQTEHCPGGKPTLPERRAVFQANGVKFGSASTRAVRMQRAPIKPRSGRRQMRTSGKTRRHGQFAAPEPRRRQSWVKIHAWRARWHHPQNKD